ncbi:E3 ubiquitin-protein ligase TRIM33-like [Sycon ciliatum]|uniref:E3 ubiquitin-protein ligase TRIM33-like n=1 Tax=Sycon ciliatum TaxID=27933 RepID=UPI0031F60CCE
MADDIGVHNAIGKDVSNLRCCVACHSAAGSLKMKVLNCLHAMCVTCLGQHLSNDGTVSCFKCLTLAASGMPGVRLEESLADWPVQRVEMRGKEGSELQSDHSEKQTVCQSLECQGESSPATSLCVDCGLYMCEGHEKVHLMKRSCYGHHLQSVHSMRTAAPAEGDTVADSEFLHCSLHQHFLAKSYCKKCEQLICRRCSEQRHASCSPSIEEIPTAAERKRSQWKSLLSNSSDSWREHLSDMNVHISTRTAEINEKVEALSEEIVADFNTHIKNLQRRQEDLLNELDTRRWKALQDLEKQSSIVEKNTFQLDCCEHLVLNLANSHLLAAEKILQTQIKDVVNSNEAADISDDHRVDVDFTVSYRAFATDDMEKKRTSQLGRLVDFASRTESVWKNTVQVQPVFDPISCEPAKFSLSSDGREVSHTDVYTLDTISTLGSYCHGVVECSAQISRLVTGVSLGVVKESCTTHAPCTGERPFLGWYCYTNYQEYSAGNNTSLGQVWQDDDIIALRLDCDQHTLTGTHQRSGQSETIAVPSGKLCFAAEMGHLTGIRFLPCLSS